MNKQPYNNEIKLYYYWKNVCNENNYRHSTCLQLEADDIVNSYKKTKPLIYQRPKIVTQKNQFESLVNKKELVGIEELVLN